MASEIARAGSESFPTLSRPPIVEALVDIRVKRSSVVSVDRLRSAHKALAARFPKVDEQRAVSALLRIGQGDAPQARTRDHGVAGLRFASADQSEMVQFGLDGFTFNRLAPYPGWAVVKPLAIDLWHSYTAVAQPELIVRVGLRFINRIPLGDVGVALDDYLLALPRLPPNWPNLISAYQSRVTLFDERSKCSAHVTQVAETTSESESPRWILDIDTYVDVELEPPSANLGRVLDTLRELKNRIFFNALTPLALDKFR
jgi:uncharacterized protein (TIGR04255 family)